MNLDELANQLEGLSSEPLLKDLSGYIEEWKADHRTVKEFENMMERFFGNVWFADQEAQKKAYETWKAFRTEAVQGINGMSMNERLYMFGLMERFDESASQEEKMVVYGKLHASPNK